MPHPPFWPGPTPYWLQNDVLEPALSGPPYHGNVERVHAAAEIWVTGEVYLELVALDLADLEAIAEFASRFGVLGVAYQRFALVSRLPGLTEVVLPELDASWSRGPRWGGDDPPVGWGVSGSETLEEFRFGTRCLRDLMRAWQIVSSVAATASISWEALPPGYTPFGHEKVDRQLPAVERTPLDEAKRVLDLMLNAGLQAIHPRFELRDRRDDDSGREDTRWVFLDVPLYSICCLELYNHIFEHATYRRCANEPCGRLFVRQRGRAQAGQFRLEGIKYCSSFCARAQAQRQYRARQRKKKTGQSSMA